MSIKEGAATSRAVDDLPCGFLSVDQNGQLLTLNNTLRSWLELKGNLSGDHIDSILTPSSRLFYQMYFVPLIRMHSQVEEIYLYLRSAEDHEVPVLINARIRESRTPEAFSADCVVIKMDQRHKLENQLIAAKNEAERADQLKRQAIDELRAAKLELETTNARLQTLATTDGLTGLVNRRSFQETLEFSIAQFIRLQNPLSLLLIDIDHFKTVNDRWGHSTGDYVLQNVAQLLDSSFRATDTVARFGGEEFAVILPGIGSKAAAGLGEKVRRTIEQTAVADTTITVSIGVATLEFRDSFSTLINRADNALYTAKQAGRNQVVQADVAQTASHLSHFRDA